MPKPLPPRATAYSVPLGPITVSSGTSCMTTASVAMSAGAVGVARRLDADVVRGVVGSPVGEAAAGSCWE